MLKTHHCLVEVATGSWEVCTLAWGTPRASDRHGNTGDLLGSGPKEASEAFSSREGCRHSFPMHYETKVTSNGQGSLN